MSRTQNLETKSDEEGKMMQQETRNRATQYQAVAEYHTSEARTQAGTVNRDLGVDRRWVGRDP